MSLSFKWTCFTFPCPSNANAAPAPPQKGSTYVAAPDTGSAEIASARYRPFHLDSGTETNALPISTVDRPLGQCEVCTCYKWPASSSTYDEIWIIADSADSRNNALKPRRVFLRASRLRSLFPAIQGTHSNLVACGGLSDCRSDPASWKAPASKLSAADQAGRCYGRRPKPTPCAPSDAA